MHLVRSELHRCRSLADRLIEKVQRQQDPDEVLEAFAVVGEPDTIAAGLLERYGDCVDRISFYAPGQGDISAYRSVMDEIKAG